MKRIFSRLVYAMVWLLALPATAQVVQGTFVNAGLTLHYTAIGVGSPVLLLSGGPGMNVDYMIPIARMVADAGHTAILLQQRGTGFSMPSALTKDTVSPSLVQSDLESLRTKLGYAQWTVLGHSSGAITAEFYAIDHPGQVRSLVLLGVLPPTLPEVARANDNLAARLTPVQRLSISQPPVNADAMMATLRTVLAADFYDRAKGEEFARTMTVNNFHADTMGILESQTQTYDLRAGLGRLRVPVLILQGRQDPYDLQLAEATRSAIPGAQMLMVEKAGHFGWIEQPDVYARALNQFLKDK